VFSAQQFHPESCDAMHTFASLQLPQMTEIWRQTLDWCPSPDHQKQFQKLLTQLWQHNQAVNLTRITEPEVFWEKHLWDSLWGINAWLTPSVSSLAINVVDIGTGGGFPGIPVAITQPHWQMTLLEATRKKVTCLDQLCKSLVLPRTRAVCERAEVFGHKPEERAQYDLALIRAVGPASSCAEYALPLLRLQGTAILYRGQWTTSEEQILRQASSALGGELVEVRNITTPLTHSQRHCLYLRKVCDTPSAFPRKVGLPVQRPLGIAKTVERFS
jgi:16S rRNA (guanine527-N7)-methyltransferase